MVVQQPPEPASVYAWDSDQIMVAARDSVPYAYRPGQVIVRAAAASEFVLSMVRAAEVTRELGNWLVISNIDDVPGVVDAATTLGFVVQPNQVLFADSVACNCPCPPHPSLANDLEYLTGNPLRTNPLRTNPLRTNPLRTNPLRTNPLRTNPLEDAAPPLNGARPVDAPGTPPISAAPIGAVPRVVIFDTGYAEGTIAPAVPPPGLLLQAGEEDFPDVVETPGDDYLDPVAGHGTFIAGVIDQACPGIDFRVPKVVDPFGAVDEVTLIDAIDAELAADEASGDSGRWPHTIYNMSFGGYLREDKAMLLAERMIQLRQRGIVIVASAGNLGECRPSFPAALPTVIGVGALGALGPAEFTNFGPWTDACAPGSDIVSTFFSNTNLANPMINGVDIDEFSGWARWSGTSFAAPRVVAALAREIRDRGITAVEAVEVVIDGPDRCRIPNLGTIVQ